MEVKEIKEGWKDLDWWYVETSKVVHERLGELDSKGVAWCPGKSNLYKPFVLTDPADIRVVLVGQDPYPNSRHATGLAFSIPKEINISTPTHLSGKVNIPPTLENIFDEYEKDLHYGRPQTGDLSPWCSRGVLLWNAYPTCEAGRSLSHAWDEWTYLTKEVLQRVAIQGTVCVFFGSVAASFAWACRDGCRTILVSHPSPRASRASKHPFLGSRIFTRVNDNLCQMGKEPIDWRL